MTLDHMHPYFQPGAPLELLGRGQVADELGVANSNVMNTRGLPPPVARPSGGPVWLAIEIRALAQERMR